MSIYYAILGMLSYRPMTGYELKKQMQESSFMYWSGNNNQIYKALVELHGKGLVTNETIHQEGSPSKKIYTITDAGLADLKKQAQSRPEPPEIKTPFLVQLAYSWQLSTSEMNGILDQYEQEIAGQLFIAQRRANSSSGFPHKTARERAVWRLIHQSRIDAYTREQAWIAQLRDILATENIEKDEVK